MDKPKRSLRRIHRYRKIKRWVYIQRNVWSTVKDETDEEVLMRARLWADNPACSCIFCHSSRRYYGPTRQEVEHAKEWGIKQRGAPRY